MVSRDHTVQMLPQTHSGNRPSEPVQVNNFSSLLCLLGNDGVWCTSSGTHVPALHVRISYLYTHNGVSGTGCRYPHLSPLTKDKCDATSGGRRERPHLAASLDDI